MKSIGRAYRAFSNLKNPSAWLTEFFGGTQSKTGIKVTTDSALGLAPVIYAANKISGHIAQLPVRVYDELSLEKEDRRQSPAWKLMNKRPNQFMTSFTMKEIMMVHALINGNGRAYIVRNSIGTPTDLLPIDPAHCQTILVDNRKYHLVMANPGTPQSAISESLKTGEYYKVPDRDMIHIMNTSYNGIWGLHIIELAKDVFGLTQASQDSTAITMANSGRPGVLLEAPTGMFRSAKDAQEFLDNFNRKHEGITNTGRAGLLRDGMKATTVPISASDAQFLEQRNFQREEIALLFGLETIMGDNSGQTYKSISERNTAYIQNCLQRWFAKWECEIEDKLVNPARPMRVEFDSTPLAKGDPNSLADYSVKMGQTGAVTINEVRAMHGFAPVEDGDKLPHQIALDITKAQEPKEGEEPSDEDTETEEPKKEDSDEARE